jgi:hypothetical protein
MDKMKYDRQIAGELCEEASDYLREALDKLQAAEALMEREQGSFESAARRAENITNAYEKIVLARNELYDASR